MRAELTGSAVAKLETGALRLTVDYALDIADALGVSLNEILGLDGQGARYLPEIGRVAAGNWREAIAMTEERVAVPGHLRGADLFVLRPEGDSMDLIVGGGGFIVVDPGDKDLIDKKHYVVMNNDGDTTFKQFSQAGMRFEPCSSNPDHKPIPIGTEPFVVIGRVIYAGRDL